jgi:hypothetical protein
MSDSSEPTRPIEDSTLEPPPPPPPPVAGTDDTLPDVDGRDETVLTPVPERPSTKSVRVLAVLVMVAGLILMAAGVVTWFVVRDQLSAEQIVVSEDADRFAGQDVQGPFTAYAQADVINEHALEASGGKTYAQLDQDDPVRRGLLRLRHRHRADPGRLGADEGRTRPTYQLSLSAVGQSLEHSLPRRA